MKYEALINGLAVSAEYSDESVEKVFLPLLRHLSEMQRSAGRRILMFLAAPPGTGKSTLCDFLGYLADKTEGISPVTVIGMDGFHMRQDYLLSHSAVLDGREVRLVDIKGNPITFDVAALKAKIEEVKGGGTVKWPLYDRLLHDPVDDAITVSGDIVILEGNYLLLDTDGWRELRQYADYTVYIRSELSDIKERLIDRKTASGTPRDEALAFVESSDLINAATCNEHTKEADLMLYMTPCGEYKKMN